MRPPWRCFAHSCATEPIPSHPSLSHPIPKRIPAHRHGRVSAHAEQTASAASPLPAQPPHIACTSAPGGINTHAAGERLDLRAHGRIHRHAPWRAGVCHRRRSLGMRVDRRARPLGRSGGAVRQEVADRGGRGKKLRIRHVAARSALDGTAYSCTTRALRRSGGRRRSLRARWRAARRNSSHGAEGTHAVYCAVYKAANGAPSAEMSSSAQSLAAIG